MKQFFESKESDRAEDNNMRLVSNFFHTAACLHMDCKQYLKFYTLNAYLIHMTPVLILHISALI